MSSTPSSKFFLIDCNQFFVSCEQLFNPKLLHQPVVVLSSNDGCVVARSKEAKALGIPMGAPAYQWQELFKRENVHVLSSNFSLYADLSTRVMQVLYQFTDEVEEYSIDEAFLSLCEEHPLEKAQEIRERILRWTGIPVSIGIGATKTLAKLASDLAKKEPSYIFALLEEKEKTLKTLAAKEVWGIGERLYSALKKGGLYTVWDLISADDSFLKKRFGIPVFRIVLELRGISCLSLKCELISPQQSITTSRSFGKPIHSLQMLQEALAVYTAKAAEKLRSQKLTASFLTCFLTTSYYIQDSYSNSASMQLPISSSYTPYLLQNAKRALQSIYKEGYAYKKVGIILQGLLPQNEKQLDLIHSAQDDVKKQKAQIAMDHLKAHLGSHAIRFAAEGTSQEWRRKKDHSSPRYTTSWDEILEICI